ncbi:MAG: CSLREA domain-containing protein [Chloroflexota bacterium]
MTAHWRRSRLEGATKRALLTGVATLCVWLTAGASTAFAAVVTNLDDSGAGSLRDSVAAAPNGDTVTFQAGLSGTITLTGGEIAIDKDLAIVGPANYAVTISGNYPAPGRVFVIGASNPAATVTLQTLTVLGGHATGAPARGGAIANFGQLNVIRVSVLNSYATADPGADAHGGGIYNSGTLFMQGGELAGHTASGGGGAGAGAARGGAFYNVGTATFKDMKFEFSLAQGGSRTSGSGTGGAGIGGALHNAGGSLTLDRVTTNTNEARGGSGISAVGGSALGGGVSIGGGTVTVINGTFSNGAATGGSGSSQGAARGGGVYLSSGAALTNVTVANNRVVSSGSAGGAGAHVETGTSVNMVNVLVANQQSGQANCGGNTGGISGQNNMHSSGSPTCGSTFASGAGVNLGMLQQNGGAIPTHQLQAGSSAINAGTNSGCPDVDERGALRAHTAHDPCDIGAFERIPPRTFTVTKLADTDDENCSPSDCSLREAIASSIAGDIVSFAPGLSGAITLTRGALFVYQDLTIAGPGPGVLAIDGNGAYRPLIVGANGNDFPINTGAVVTVSGLTLRNGRAPNGGGVYNIATLTLANVNVTGNVAQGGFPFGGGIDSRGGTLTVVNSSIYGNVAQSTGGGSSTAYGGGLASRSNSGGGTLSLTNVTVSGNSVTGAAAENAGGGVYVTSTGAPAVTLLNSTIGFNSVAGAGAKGGGIHRGNSGTLNIRNAITANNMAGGSGSNCSGSGMVAAVTSLQYGEAAASCPGFVVADPRLGTLVAFGVATPVHPLGGGSAAIDSGSDSGCPSTDQRGIARPVGAHCDVGAVEYFQPQPAPPARSVSPAAQPPQALPTHRTGVPTGAPPAARPPGRG